MAPKELFLPPQKRYRPVVAHQDLSDEEIAMDWTLSEADRLEIGQYRKNSRLFIAIQLCAVCLYGRFVAEANNLSPRINSYPAADLKALAASVILAKEILTSCHCRVFSPQSGLTHNWSGSILSPAFFSNATMPSVVGTFGLWMS